MDGMNNGFRIADGQRCRRRFSGRRSDPARLRQVAEPLFIGDPRQPVAGLTTRGVDGVVEMSETLGESSPTGLGARQTQGNIRLPPCQTSIPCLRDQFHPDSRVASAKCRQGRKSAAGSR